MRPWRSEFGPEGKHFVSGNSRFFILVGSAKLRWGGAPFGVLMGPKRLVCTVHGRARVAKTPPSGELQIVFGMAAYFIRRNYQILFNAIIFGGKVAATLIF